MCSRADQGETLAGALELAPVRANVIALAVHLMANTAVTGDVFRYPNVNE